MTPEGTLEGSAGMELCFPKFSVLGSREKYHFDGTQEDKGSREAAGCSADGG